MQVFYTDFFFFRQIVRKLKFRQKQSSLPLPESLFRFLIFFPFCKQTSFSPAYFVALFLLSAKLIPPLTAPAARIIKMSTGASTMPGSPVNQKPVPNK